MRRPEQSLQKQLVRFLDIAYPQLLYWHTPNGGARSSVEGAIFKAMGVKAGVPDLAVILPNGLAAFVELKAGKGSLTESQKAFRDRVQKLGCPWAEVRSLEEAMDLLDRWLTPFGWRARVTVAA